MKIIEVKMNKNVRENELKEWNLKNKRKERKKGMYAKNERFGINKKIETKKKKWKNKNER